MAHPNAECEIRQGEPRTDFDPARSAFGSSELAAHKAQITQGAVVSNELLSCILRHIKDKQATKDAEGLKKARTKRDKRLLLQRIKATG